MVLYHLKVCYFRGETPSDWSKCHVTSRPTSSFQVRVTFFSSAGWPLDVLKMTPRFGGFLKSWFVVFCRLVGLKAGAWWHGLAVI